MQKLNATYGANVPLVLMNSFNTHDDTLKARSCGPITSLLLLPITTGSVTEFLFYADLGEVLVVVY